MNRQRWMRTRRKLDRQVGARMAESFRRDVRKMAERDLFFGERGPEQLTSVQRVNLAGSAVRKVFPNQVAR
jgi:hypothetical protein